jgi:Domain of unknown function (DUF1906)
MQMRRAAIVILAIGLTIIWIGGPAVGRAVPAGPLARLAAQVTHVSSSVKTVHYGGYTLDVPASWPVYYLGTGSTVCVKYDRNAVYLGVPGINQDCPARVFGRVATISLQVPAAGLPAASLPGGANGPAAGTGHPASALPAVSDLPQVGGAVLADAQNHELYATAHGLGLSVSGTYGSDAGPVLKIIQSLRRSSSQSAVPRRPAMAGARMAVTAGARPAAGAVAPAGTALASAGSASGSAAGLPASPALASRVAGSTAAERGFDACTAPSLAVMQAWRSTFSYAGIYIGGAEVGCAPGNLSAAWVSSVTALGWGLIPTYVGAQAPCNKQFTVRIHPSWANPEGQAAAQWAVQDAAALGMGRGTPIYEDMESYNAGNASCRNSVLSFLNGWTREIHALGYVSGVYSSAGTGIEALGLASSVYGVPLAEPDSVWFALWDGGANVTGTPYLYPSWWQGRRIKQYLGAHNRKVNGFTVNIDSDLIGGQVYR